MSSDPDGLLSMAEESIFCLSPLPRIQCLPTNLVDVFRQVHRVLSLSPLPRIQCLPTYARRGENRGMG